MLVLLHVGEVDDLSLLLRDSGQVGVDLFQGDSVALELVDQVLVVSPDVRFRDLKLDVFRQVVCNLQFTVLKFLHLLYALLLRLDEHVP